MLTSSPRNKLYNCMWYIKICTHLCHNNYLLFYCPVFFILRFSSLIFLCLIILIGINITIVDPFYMTAIFTILHKFFFTSSIRVFLYLSTPNNAFPCLVCLWISAFKPYVIPFLGSKFSDQVKYIHTIYKYFICAMTTMFISTTSASATTSTKCIKPST